MVFMIKNKLKEIIRSNILLNVARTLRDNYYIFLGKHFPKKLVKDLYRKYYNKEIDLDVPVDIDEKINWLKFNADLSLWTRCADKYEVRSFIKERGIGHTLNELLGVYDNPKDIDYDKLPNQFVIKTTSGGGGNNVLIVKDKTTFDIISANKKLKQWLRMTDYYLQYEPHYKDIIPRIIIEKYLVPSEDELTLIDYKFNCCNGTVQNILLCTERGNGKHPCLSLYDTEWSKIENCVLPEYMTEKYYPKPKSLEKMIEYSRILSRGFPYVRVDWYEVNGTPIFGELTFTPSGGFHIRYSKTYRNELGKCINLGIVPSNE